MIHDPVSSWDSPRSAAKLIIGLFLVIGLFSFFVFGIKQLLFIREHNISLSPTKINLLETPDAHFGKGYFEVTGFLGGPMEYIYYGGDTGATTFYYYTLSSHSEKPDIKLLVRDNNNPPSLEAIEPTMITLQGIIGIESAPSEIQKPFKNNPPLLILDAVPPKLSTLLRWFIPVGIGFLVGLFLVIDWLYRAKKQNF